LASGQSLHASRSPALAAAWQSAAAAGGAVQLALQYVSSCSQFCLPPQDQSRLNVRVQTEGGSSIEAAAPLLAKVEQRDPA
jgi:multidrug efflux pump subunit AcrB